MLEYTATRGSSYVPHTWETVTTAGLQGEKPTYYVSNTTHDGGEVLGLFPHVPTTGSPVDGIRELTYERMRAYREFLRGLAAPKVVAAPTRTPVQNAIARITNLTGLTQESVAFLCGVSRQQLIGWNRGEGMSAKRRRHIFQLLDVLQRAARTRSAQEVAAWLDSPQGDDAKNPAQLLRDKEYDRARFLSVSVSSLTVAATPEWAKRNSTLTFRAGSTGWQDGLSLDRDMELKRLLDESDAENEEG